MDPRQARRQNRGSGMGSDMDGAGFDELVGEARALWHGCGSTPLLKTSASVLWA